MLKILLCFILLTASAAAVSPWHNPNCAENRYAIVHLFEWRWTDIAAECERFLGPMGFCGVQVSPPNEHMVDPFGPWWQRYQPVSYKLESRSGNEAEFIDMVQRCNNAKVRIYVDAIINHMAGVDRSGVGSGGTEYNSEEFYFPGVPYSESDFHSCEECGTGCCCVDRWTDLDVVRQCRLVGLNDLNQKVTNVQDKIVEYFNKVMDIGVAGFRIDAAKHMYPEDIEIIWGKLNNLNTQWFPAGSKPFMFLEVIDMNQFNEVQNSWYTHLGRVTEFRYCVKVKNAAGDLPQAQWLWDAAWGMLPPEDAFVFVDNHDNQRGHGAGGDVLNYKDPYKYKLAQAITLSANYGYPRVMSSYDFTNTDAGPPSSADGTTNNVPINPDGSCGGGWICEHRWKPIAGMVTFSKAVSGTYVDYWWSEGNQVAIGRQGKGFFVATNYGSLDRIFPTGMPAGQYCNVIQGCPTESGCEGDTITVDGNGNARIVITDGANPMAAIHVEATAGSRSCTWDDGGITPGPTPAPTTTVPGPTTTGEPTTTTIPPPSTTSGPTEPPPEGYARTVIFIQAQTNVGEDLFYRGGISHAQRPGCTEDASTSACAVPIIHNELGTSSHYDGYNAWKVGDSKLDWYGAEQGQGEFSSRAADGTPSAWTTNNQGNAGYHPLNQFGDHYWLVDLDMDCDATENGWFEVKSFITNRGWEGGISQDSTCDGTAGGSKPYVSDNHFGRCGFINVFYLNSGRCTINNF